MRRKPKNIFLHFLNSDTQQIFGLESLKDIFVKSELRKCINAAILLCDENTYCIMPIGFWFESEYTRELLMKYPRCIDSGYIRFSMREENVREFLEKKREQYTPFLNQKAHNKAYESFFQEDVFSLFLQLNPRLIDRKTKIGHNCAELWASNHTILISDNTGDFIQAYKSIEDISERTKIAEEIRKVVLDPEKPFVWGNVRTIIDELYIKDPAFTKELRIQFEKNYYTQYLEEYKAVNLYNSHIDKGIDFLINLPGDAISSYLWLELYLEHVDLIELLSIADRKLVKVKKSKFWRVLLEKYVALCNQQKNNNFAHCLLNLKIDEELEEAILMIKEIIMDKAKAALYKIDANHRQKKIVADVLIMIATNEEEEAIKKSEDWVSRKTDEGYEYFFLDKGKFTFALAKSIGMGSTNSAIAIQEFANYINPRFYAMAGFCAGKKNKVNLGDVFVPIKIYQYGTGKQLEETKILPENESFKLDPLWIQKIERFGDAWRNNINLKRPLTYESQMKTFIEIMEGCNYKEKIITIREHSEIPNIVSIIKEGRDHNYLNVENGYVTATTEGLNYYKNVYALEYYDYKDPKLEIRMGALATGNQVQEWDQIFNRLEHQYDRKTYALDMEGYAIANVAWIKHAPFIVAKGVGDFASGSKAFDNRYISYATVASFKFLLAFFESLEGKDLLGK